MKIRTSLACLSALVLLGATSASGQPVYPPPAGGWTYIYNGDQLIVGIEDPCGAGDNNTAPAYPACPAGWNSLDGTWTHQNNSDEWDGSVIGGYSLVPGLGFGTKNAPGGAILGTNGTVTYLRMQDCGDPRDYDTSSGEWDDPGSRKIYFGHNIGTDIDPVKAQTIMRSGVTLSFRARIPTLAKADPPLDPLHRDGQQASGVQPYPTNGDGYVTSDGGKGNFVIREGGNGADVPAAAIAFSFTQTTDTTGGNPNTGQAGFAGLTFNEFNGNVPTANVNFGQGSKTNVVAFDPTEWHEIYIVLRDDPADIGTHEAFIFVDGNLRPVVYKITGGTGSDMNDSFLALGGSATPQNWALDVDWFAYKDDQVFPPGAQLPPTIFGFVPVDRTMFHPVASNLVFSTSALMPTNTLPASGIKVILNGQDVSSQLVLTGNDASKSRKVTFNGLQANTIYSATYIVTDSGGLSTTNDISFDTLVEAQVKLLEAEEYNYGAGQFIEDPVPGLYLGQFGTLGVDFFDTTLTTFGTYRGDEADTAVTTDTARTKFTSAGQPDYQLGAIARGEWANYTCTLTNPPYSLYVRYASTATTAQDIRVDRVTSDRTQPNQTLEFLGVLRAPRTGTLGIFNYAQLTDLQGRPVALPFSGTTTLRLTAASANDDLALNFFFLMPVGTPAEPGVTVTPAAGTVGVAGDAKVEVAIFDGTSPVTQGSVKLRVNGAEVPATVAKAGGVTSVKYAPSLWAPATTYALNLTFNDGTARSCDWSFTTLNYPVLTPGMKATGVSTPGFVWKVHQNEANQDATLAKADGILGGTLVLANLADPNALGPASAAGTPASPGNGMMTFRVPTVLNVGQTTVDNEGNFTPDEQMPGIPGTTGGDPGLNGIVVDATAFLDLPAGLVTLGVNSDDGFRTTAGYLNDAPLLIAQVDGGRSATDTLMQVGVEQAGTYAFRTVYYEGGGGAAFEWFMVKADGTKVLLNDTANGGIRAYQQGTIPAMPVAVRITARLNASGDVVLEWPAGTLQSAGTVNGSYQTVNGATSPWTVDAAGATEKYYRVKVQ